VPDTDRTSTNAGLEGLAAAEGVRNSADSPRRSTIESPDQYAIVEVAGSGLFGHPLLRSLASPSVSMFRPALVSFEAAVAAAVNAMRTGPAIDCAAVLLGTSVLTRVASVPADIDILVYFSVDESQADASADARVRADTIARFLTVLSDSVCARGGENPLAFVRLNVFVPLTHSGYPGAVKEYCCSWSREDLQIGSTVASLGSIELQEALGRGGQPVLTLSTALEGAPIMIDVRLDLYRRSGTGLVPTVMDAHTTWAGTLATSPRGARLPQEVEQSMLQRDPSATAQSAALHRREAHAVLKAGPRRYPKALKYAVQGLAFGGHIESAMVLARFLGSRECVSASFGSRLANLLTAARRRWTDRASLHDATRRLAAEARARLQAPHDPGHASPPDGNMSEFLERWERDAKSDPRDPRTWASLGQTARGLQSLADLPALGFLRANFDALEAMPKLRLELKRHSAA